MLKFLCDNIINFTCGELGEYIFSPEHLLSHRRIKIASSASEGEHKCVQISLGKMKLFKWDEHISRKNGGYFLGYA